MEIKPYTAADLRELNRTAATAGEDTRLMETIASILDRVDRLELHENAFYRQPPPPPPVPPK